MKNIDLSRVPGSSIKNTHGHADGDQKSSAQMTQISEPHLRRSVPIHVGESIQTKILPTTSSSSAR